jgi:hypothetical protein
MVTLRLRTVSVLLTRADPVAVLLARSAPAVALRRASGVSVLPRGPASPPRLALSASGGLINLPGSPGVI